MSLQYVGLFEQILLVFFLTCNGARSYLVYMPIWLSKVTVLWTPTTRIIFKNFSDFLNKSHCFLPYLGRGPMLSGIYAHATQSQQLSKIMVLWTPTTRIIFPWKSFKCHKVSFWKFLYRFWGNSLLGVSKNAYIVKSLKCISTMRILPSLSFRQKWVEDLFKGR